jgi:hypothetical protein
MLEIFTYDHTILYCHVSVVTLLLLQFVNSQLPYFCHTFVNKPDVNKEIENMPQFSNTVSFHSDQN